MFYNNETHKKIVFCNTKFNMNGIQPFISLHDMESLTRLWMVHNYFFQNIKDCIVDQQKHVWKLFDNMFFKFLLVIGT